MQQPNGASAKQTALSMATQPERGGALRRRGPPAPVVGTAPRAIRCACAALPVARPAPLLEREADGLAAARISLPGEAGARFAEPREQRQWREEEQRSQQQQQWQLEQREQVHITRRICASRCWQEAFQVFLDCSHRFNGINTAALATRMAQLVGGGHQQHHHRHPQQHW